MAGGFAILIYRLEDQLLSDARRVVSTAFTGGDPAEFHVLGLVMLCDTLDDPRYYPPLPIIPSSR